MADQHMPALFLKPTAKAFERQLRSACEAIIADARSGRAPSAAAAGLRGNDWFLGRCAKSVNPCPAGTSASFRVTRKPRFPA